MTVTALAKKHDAPAPRPRKPRAEKAAGAYLTIGELAEQLQIGQHVLRFWESKFPQIQPLKRAGGRRYYSPQDAALLRRVQTLLYRDGYTIRGVQLLLDDNGTKLNSEITDRPVHDSRWQDLENHLHQMAVFSVPDPSPAERQQIHAEAGETIRVRRRDLEKLVNELMSLRKLLAET